MENHVNRESSEVDCKLPPRVEFENSADATGLWFAAAMLCAVLAAGVIVYRTGNSDFSAVSNVVAENPAPAGR